MIARRYVLTLLATVALVAGAADAQEPRYQVGGALIAPELQQRLDDSIDLIRLGINSEWIAGSGFQVEPVIHAYLEIVDSVRRGEIPGCVMHVDSFTGQGMPVGVGWRMTDPQQHQTTWSTYYELGDLTGAVVVTPMTLHALEGGEIQLRQTVGHWLPEFRQTNKEPITIEQLLRHTSGLPVSLDLAPSVRTRDQLLRVLRDMPLTDEPGTRVKRSGLNFLLLGLILEQVHGAPVQEVAHERMLVPLGMVNTVSDFPDHLREDAAAGPYSKWHGRMAWAEAGDASAFILGPSAGNGGVVTNPDDMAIFARAMLLAYTVGLGDFVSTPTMQHSLMPDLQVAGGENQGLGWALNGLGPGSFGWDSPNGCSIWVLPAKQVFVVMLGNANHPTESGDPFARTRSRVLRLLTESLADAERRAWIGPRGIGREAAVLAHLGPASGSRFSPAGTSDLNCHEPGDSY